MTDVRLDHVRDCSCNSYEPDWRCVLPGAATPSSTPSPAPVASPPPPKRSKRAQRALPETILLTGLTDPLLEERGHHISSVYVESFWLPILGPSALWLLRHVSRMLDATQTYEVEARVLAARVGLGARLDGDGQLARTLDRIVSFQAGIRDGESTWRLRTHLGTLPRRHVARLDPDLQSAHNTVRWPARAVSAASAAP